MRQTSTRSAAGLALMPLALLALTTASAHEPPNATLTWEEAFPVATAPADVHFRARYADSTGALHTLEVWRHGDEFLHRRTDRAIDLYSVAEAETGQERLRLLDHRRSLVADVSRTNLYRIGIWSDGFGLRHVLERPLDGFRIASATAPRGVRADECEWRELIRNGLTADPTLVCWSARWGLPMVIVRPRAGNREVFRVEQTDNRVPPAGERGLPRIPDGYAVVDVNDEIDASAD